MGDVTGGFTADPASRKAVCLASELEALGESRLPRIFGAYAASGACMVGPVKIPAGTTDGFWERHNGGDELLHCLQGRLLFTVRSENRDRQFELGPGDVLLIPRGAAHSAHIIEDAHLFFVTPRDGNEAWSDDPSVAPRHP